MEAAHDQLTRPKPDEIEANYEIDANLYNPAPQIIGLFDDVLTRSLSPQLCWGD